MEISVENCCFIWLIYRSYSACISVRFFSRACLSASNPCRAVARSASSYAIFFLYSSSMNFLSCSWVYFNSAITFSYFSFYDSSSLSLCLFNLPSISWYSFRDFTFSYSSSSISLLISARSLSSADPPAARASWICYFRSAISFSSSAIVTSLSETMVLVFWISLFLSIIVFEATSSCPVLSANCLLRSSISFYSLSCISLVVPPAISRSRLRVSRSSSICFCMSSFMTLYWSSLRCSSSRNLYS